MKISNEAVFSGLLALRELLTKELPVVAAYKVRKLHKELSDLWKVVEDTKVSLLEWHATKNADGTLATEIQGEAEVAVFTPSARAEYDAAWMQLLREEVEVKTTIRVTDFGEVSLTPTVFIGLGDLITEE